jgi:hypothetical protein
MRVTEGRRNLLYLEKVSLKVFSIPKDDVAQGFLKAYFKGGKPFNSLAYGIGEQEQNFGLKSEILVKSAVEAVRVG